MNVEYRDWDCRVCGKHNWVSIKELEINDEYKCSECERFHIIELMCSDEITVECF